MDAPESPVGRAIDLPLQPFTRREIAGGTGSHQFLTGFMKAGGLACEVSSGLNGCEGAQSA